MTKYIESVYGSQIKVEADKDDEVFLDLGYTTDVFLSPESAIDLADWLRRTAYRVLERMEEKENGV